MKVEELIKELQQFNPKAEVSLKTSETIYISYICKDLENNELNPKTTMQLFIEGCDNYEKI